MHTSQIKELELKNNFNNQTTLEFDRTTFVRFEPVVIWQGKFLDNIYNSLLSIARIIIQSRPQTTPSSLGAKLNILGNAPSLLRADIDCTIPSMVTNGFALDESMWLKVKPKYYVLSDWKFKDPTFPFWQAILAHDWDLNIFIWYKRKDTAINHYARYNKTTIEGFNWFVRLGLRLGLGMPSPANVLIPCLTNAMSMGYTEIHLYGFEFDWYKQTIFGEKSKTHFYDEKEYQLPNLEESLFTFWRTVKGLNIIKKYVEDNGVKIINHSNWKII